MEKLLKKLLNIYIAIVSAMIILSIISFLIYSEFKYSSVYYAKNMPNTRKEIEMMALVDNLNWTDTLELEGFEYDIDGTHTIIIKNNNKGEYINYYFSNSYDDEGNEYVYDDKNFSYWFDKNFKLQVIFNNNEWPNKIDIESIDEEAVKQELYDLLKPLIDEQPKPFINMQWLFNYIYKDVYK